MPESLPTVFHVPRNSVAVFDYSPSSNSPECIVKRVFLSPEPDSNSVVLYGVGGSGKTTILQDLPFHDDIRQKFIDGIWFFSLGDHITLRAFLTQLEQLVQCLFPEYLPSFVDFANSNSADAPDLLVKQLLGHLAEKSFLLLFDDVPHHTKQVHDLVASICTAINGLDTTSLNVAISTRQCGNIDGRIVHVSPARAKPGTSLQIFCKHARVKPSAFVSLSSGNQYAISSILLLCNGLPLALSIAGSILRHFWDPLTETLKPFDFAEFGHMLTTIAAQFFQVGNPSFQSLITSSLEFIDANWESDLMSASEMFRSMSILPNQQSVPLETLRNMWGVDLETAMKAVRLLSRASVDSLALDFKAGDVCTLCVPNLVLDSMIRLAEQHEGVQMWHNRLLDAYCQPLNILQDSSPEGHCVEWWGMTNVEKYMWDNLVWHMLGAGRIRQAVSLLTDYRWIEIVNEDSRFKPFQKILYDFRMVLKHLETFDKGHEYSMLLRDMNVLVQTITHSINVDSLQNSREGTFQLHMALSSLQLKSTLVNHLLHSIEQFGKRPWVRAGAGILHSAKSLKLPLGHLRWMEFGSTDEELIILDEYHHLWVVDSRNGIEMFHLSMSNDPEVVGFYMHSASQSMYACSICGVITVWRNYQRSGQYQISGLETKSITCMLRLDAGQIALGLSCGEIAIIDMGTARIIKIMTGHTGKVTSMSVGSKWFVSASDDGTVRVWHLGTFQCMGVMVGHTDCVNSVALSIDEETIASASSDGTIRLWSTDCFTEICSPLTAHSGEVYSVAFHHSTSRLYSGGDCQILEWDLSHLYDGVSIIHRFQNDKMGPARMLRIGSDCKLFAAGNSDVFVWPTFGHCTLASNSEAAIRNTKVFALSPNDETVATWAYGSHSIELQYMGDIMEGNNRVIRRVLLPNDQRGAIQKLAVSNDRRFVAYATCNTVFVVETARGRRLLNLSDLICHEQRAQCSNSTKSYHVEALSFSSDNSVLTVITQFCDSDRNMKSSVSLNVSNGEQMPCSAFDGTRLIQLELSPVTGIVTRERQRLICAPKKTQEDDAESMELRIGSANVTLARLEYLPVATTHYNPITGRLWTMMNGQIVHSLDIIWDSSKLPQRLLPSPLISSEPLLLHPTPESQQQQTARRCRNENKPKPYDVFISHAGPDKETLVKLLCEALVQLGFSVFLDKLELRAGQNASQRMIDAMKSAKIAIVILSPEFAARKWTFKELECFLRRFDEAGERGVIIIPVFYRLSLQQCAQENFLTLLNMMGENGSKVFDTEQFRKRFAQNRNLLSDIITALGRLCSITGIENDERATNEMNEEQEGNRKKLVHRVVKAVVEAKDRLDEGRAEGPSREQT